MKAGHFQAFFTITSFTINDLHGWYQVCFSPSAMAQQAHSILIVDDQESDRRLLELALKRATNLRIVGLLETGEETIAYLSGTGKFADRTQYPIPNLLVLNFRMPRLTGLDVLTWLQERSFPDLKVVMLSGSLDVENKDRALGLGAHLYMEKPMEFAGWVHLAKLMEKHLKSDN
jgi:CheY-like chemotaxis protein